MSDKEFETKISQLEFKKIMDDSYIKNRFEDFLVNAKDSMEDQQLKIDAIELVGEATRMPYVEGEIKDVFY